MSKMWSARKADRAERLRLVESTATTFERDPFAEGYAVAQMAARIEFAEERAMLTRLIEAAATLSPTDAEPLAALLAETVLRLVEDVVGSAPVDQHLLHERTLALAAAIHGPDGHFAVQVHPDCVALLDGLRSDIRVSGDIKIEPGEIVMSMGERAAEDGTMSALDRVRAALGSIL